jgi:hypothetical protein
MATTHFSGPVKSGPKVPTGQVSAQGNTVLMQEYTLDPTAVTSGVGVAAFRLPKGSSLVGVQVAVITASDSATSAVIKITDGTSDIVTGFNAKAVANSLLSVAAGDAAVAAMALFLAPAASADTNLQVVYTEVGAASVGALVVQVLYLQGA